MFLWDMMDLSRSLNFFGIVAKDHPIVVATGLEDGIGDFPFIFAACDGIFFLEGTSRRLCPSYSLWMILNSLIRGPKMSMGVTLSGFYTMSILYIRYIYQVPSDMPCSWRVPGYVRTPTYLG